MGIAFRWDRKGEIADSLRQGLESRITFTVRVYQRRQGILPFGLPFGRDRLLAEETVARRAFWDFLDGKYVIQEEGGSLDSFVTPEALLEQFFSLEEAFDLDAARDPRRSLSVMARAQLEPVRLMPPLTIVALVGKAATYTTPWARKDVQ